MTGTDSARTAEAEPPALARAGGDELGDSAPQRFRVEFTATEEYVRLVQEARALLSHRAPRLTLEDVYLRAMRAFVEALRKQKYGSKEPAGATTDEAIVADGRGMAAGGGLELPRGADNERASNQTDSAPTPSIPRRRGRHIPAAVRRVVAARDHHRCAYVDASGRRCAETQRLEFHHIVPFAVCRSHEVANLTLRCQAHNALAAEQDFGRDVIEDTKNAARHDSFSKHGP